MTTPALMIVDAQKAVDGPASGQRGQPEMEDRIAAVDGAFATDAAFEERP